VALVVAAVLGIGVIATAWLFVWPPSRPPASADAVVMLSGDHGERLPVALALIRSGVSTTLVHAGGLDTPEARELCEGGQAFEVICLSIQGDNTRNEARAVGDLSRARGWRTLVVVTSTHHATRAGLTFRRCVDGTVHVVHARAPFDARLTVRVIADEWLKVAYSLTVDRGC
jgi:uncharacterized SAM-binding protein YcdF (DUF218 family)